MMIVFGITVAVIFLLITILIVLRRRKSCSSKESPINEFKSAKPQQETKPVTSAESDRAVPAEINISALPQDSILRRHYFFHVCNIFDALAPQRPTESVLCRHYDTMMVAKMARCLSDKKAMAQLIFDYDQIRS